MEALVPDPQPQETVPGAHRVGSKNEEDGGRHCPLLAGNPRIIRSENQLGYTLLDLVLSTDARDHACALARVQATQLSGQLHRKPLRSPQYGLPLDGASRPTAEPRGLLATSLRHYNEVLPHSSLNDLTPTEYAKKVKEEA